MKVDRELWPEAVPAMLRALAAKRRPDLQKALMLSELLAFSTEPKGFKKWEAAHLYLAMFLDENLKDWKDSQRLHNLLWAFKAIRLLGGISKLTGCRDAALFIESKVRPEIVATYRIMDYLCRYRARHPNLRSSAEKRRGRAVNRPAPQAQDTILDAQRFVAARSSATRNSHAPKTLRSFWSHYSSPKSLQKAWEQHRHQAPYIYAAFRNYRAVLISLSLFRPERRAELHHAIQQMCGSRLGSFLSDAAIAADILAEVGVKNFDRRLYPNRKDEHFDAAHFTSSELITLAELAQERKETL